MHSFTNQPTSTERDWLAKLVHMWCSWYGTKLVSLNLYCLRYPLQFFVSYFCFSFPFHRFQLPVLEWCNELKYGMYYATHPNQSKAQYTGLSTVNHMTTIVKRTEEWWKERRYKLQSLPSIYCLECRLEK